MFSRKRVTRLIASVITAVMLTALIPFAASDKVRADGPDTEHYASVHVYDRETIYNGQETVTFKFDTEDTMMYRIHVREVDLANGCGSGPNALAVYDKNKKLIKTSDVLDMTIQLEGGTYYYVVYNGKDTGFEIFFDYNFRLQVEYKIPGSDKYNTLQRNAYFWSQTYGGYWDRYPIMEGSDVKLSLSIGDLPSGMKLDYSWGQDKDKSGNFMTIGTANSPLSLNVGKDVDDYYLCNVKSKDGSVDTSFVFNLETGYMFAYKDGSTFACSVKAFKPGEERGLSFPDFVYGGNRDKDISYGMMEISENGKTKYDMDKSPDKIPSDWKYASVFCYASGSNATNSLEYMLFYFVFADGDGIKAKSGETYHIDDSADKEGRGQAILNFTPETTGSYSLTFSNSGSYAMALAVFDSDRNVVAENIGSYSDPTGLWNNGKDYDLTVELTAGKTYYIAIPKLIGEFNFDLSISGGSNSSNSSTTGGGFEDFVERLYTVALNRPSEPEGKAFWCEHVGNGDLNGAQCANEFLLSKEFNDRKLTDEQFLAVLYKTFFDREAKDDKDGFNFWMNCLKTQGRDSVVDCFINSEEWCNVCASYGVRSGATRAKATIASANATAFATRLYTECLGRDAEEEGLKFWSLGLTNQELSGTQAAKEFFYSPEFVNAKYSNEEYINRMYKTFMGREPEAEGKAYWLDLLSKGTSRDEVFNFFSTCEEFTGICNEYAIQR